MQLSVYYRVAGLRGVICATWGKVTGSTTNLTVKMRDLRTPVTLRIPSSDASTCVQVFLDQEYAFNCARPPRTIIDAGANIGLASIYFANKFPDARVVAIEPDPGNYDLLKRNVAPYPNVTTIRAALWGSNKKINLYDPGLGHWGYAAGEVGDPVAGSSQKALVVDGLTVDAVMSAEGFSHVDILKMDIEGGEREVLSAPSAWLAKVDTLIVELHERTKTGCEEVFESCVAPFDDRWIRGENVFVTRKSACVTR